MKVLLIHYKYGISGGPEKYLFNVKEMIEKDGNEVILFSIKWNTNIPYSKDRYWPSIKESKGNFSLNNISDLSLIDKFLLIKKSIYNKEVYTHLNDLIEKEKPDIAYLKKIKRGNFLAGNAGGLPIFWAYAPKTKAPFPQVRKSAKLYTMV